MNIHAQTLKRKKKKLQGRTRNWPSRGLKLKTLIFSQRFAYAFIPDNK